MTSQLAIRDALKALLRGLALACGDEAQYNKTVSILTKAVNNLLANPEADRFRSIPLINATVRDSVVRFQPALDFLELAGFKQSESRLHFSGAPGETLSTASAVLSHPPSWQDVQSAKELEEMAKFRGKTPLLPKLENFPASKVGAGAGPARWPAVGGAGGAGTGAGGAAPAKRGPREKAPFTGISNQGATCYLNSLLQSMFHNAWLRSALYQAPVTGHNLTASLQELFVGMQQRAPSAGGSGGAASTVELTSQGFGWARGEAFEQHDVQELSRVLCDRLERQLLGTRAAGTIKEMLEGRTRSYLRCLDVEYSSERDEAFYDVSLNVRGCESLQQSLASFIQPELLDGDNRYTPTKALGPQRCEKGVAFLSFPPVLQLHLKRFTYDLKTGNRIKVNDAFSFPPVLDLAPFLDAKAAEGKAKAAAGAGSGAAPMDTSSDNRSSSSTGGSDSSKPAGTAAAVASHVYHLFSVFVHAGGTAGGHYFTFVRAARPSAAAAASSAESKTGSGSGSGADAKQQQPSDKAQGKDDAKDDDVKSLLEQSCWLRCDDEHVTFASQAEAVEENFGNSGSGGGGGGGKSKTANAYMLVYVREDSLRRVLDASSLSQLPQELQQGLARLRAEREAEMQARREAAQRINLYVTTPVDLETQQPYAAKGGGRVDIDLFRAFQQKAMRKVAVSKQDTLASLRSRLEAETGVPCGAARMRYWTLRRPRDAAVFSASGSAGGGAPMSQLQAIFAAAGAKPTSLGASASGSGAAGSGSSGADAGGDGSAGVDEFAPCPDAREQIKLESLFGSSTPKVFLEPAQHTVVCAGHAQAAGLADVEAGAGDDAKGKAGESKDKEKELALLADASSLLVFVRWVDVGARTAGHGGCFLVHRSQLGAELLDSVARHLEHSRGMALQAADPVSSSASASASSSAAEGKQEGKGGASGGGSKAKSGAGAVWSPLFFYHSGSESARPLALDKRLGEQGIASGAVLCAQLASDPDAGSGSGSGSQSSFSTVPALFAHVVNTVEVAVHPLPRWSDAYAAENKGKPAAERAQPAPQSFSLQLSLLDPFPAVLAAVADADAVALPAERVQLTGHNAMRGLPHGRAFDPLGSASTAAMTLKQMLTTMGQTAPILYYEISKDNAPARKQNLTVEWHELLPLHARSRHPQSHSQPRLLRPYSLALARTGRVRDAIEALRAVLASSPPELPPSERDPEPGPASAPETAAASASAAAEESKDKADGGASSSGSDGAKPAAMDTTADDDAGAAPAGSGSESKQSAAEAKQPTAEEAEVKFSVPAAGELRLLEVAHHKVVRVLHPDFPLAKLQTSLGGEWGALRAERIPREELAGDGLGFAPAYELAGAPAAAAAPSDSKSAGGSGGGETKKGSAASPGRVVPLVHFARDAEASPTGPVTTSRMRCFGTPLLVPVAARDTAATLALRLQQLLGVPRAEWEHKDKDRDKEAGQGWRLYVCSHGYARPCKEGEALLEAHAFKGKDFLALEHRESNARTVLHAASTSAGGPGGAQGRRKRPEKALFIKE